MAKRDKPEPKHKEEVRVVPNFGFVRVLDRELQKQLDDLNEMKSLNPGKKVKRSKSKPYIV
jgi:hypothetical protein